MASKARGLADLGNVYSDGALSNRNMVINGAMQVAQRGTSFTGIGHGDNQYTLDRQYIDLATTSAVVLSASQSSDAPSGFNNSLLVTTTTSGATGANDYSYIRQMIEGYNFAHLNFGTANAQTFTLSFWVKSSLTGTFGGYLGAAANDRFQTFAFSVSSANTWEYKSIVVTGDISGTWNTTNGVGLQVAWSLSCGSTYQGATGAWGSSLLLGATGQTNVTETTSATWQITGVQLEVGDTATPFEQRSYGDELAKCQRYFERFSFTTHRPLSTAAYYNTVNAYAPITFVTKRASPTISVSSAGAVTVWATGSSQVTTAVSSTSVSLSSARLNLTTAAKVAGDSAWVELTAASDYLDLASEL